MSIFSAAEGDPPHPPSRENPTSHDSFIFYTLNYIQIFLLHSLNLLYAFTQVFFFFFIYGFSLTNIHE